MVKHCNNNVNLKLAEVHYRLSGVEKVFLFSCMLCHCVHTWQDCSHSCKDQLGYSSTLANVLWFLRGFAEEAQMPTVSSQQQSTRESWMSNFRDISAWTLFKIASEEHRSSTGLKITPETMSSIDGCGSNSHKWPHLVRKPARILVLVVTLRIPRGDFFRHWWFMSCFHSLQYVCIILPDKTISYTVWLLGTYNFVSRASNH